MAFYTIKALSIRKPTPLSGGDYEVVVTVADTDTTPPTVKQVSLLYADPDDAANPVQILTDLTGLGLTPSDWE